ncbi:hypothetical protein [Streptomyces sp. NPDC057694]|uniref:hypothetical protein n=1 Tax=Streptomyces sp. NPDC057694 TaxID=3346216 RepID=UPI0036A1737D
MPASLLPPAQIAVTIALAGWMLTRFFTNVPGRWMRWAMFCRANFTIATLAGTKDGRTEPVNVYAYLSPGSFVLGPPQLQAILIYLTRSGRYDRIDGHGRLLDADGERPLTVEDSHVVR